MLEKKIESNNDLETKIINDLKKTGFISEMTAMKSFISRNWKVSGNRSYFDLDENKTCEIDLEAYHFILYQDQNNKILARSFFMTVAEVKKTKNPWIIFRGNHQNKGELQEGWDGLVFCNGLKNGKVTEAFTQTMLTSGLAYTRGWFGYGIHEAFKDPNQSSQWYQALVKACKAGEDILKANSTCTESSHTYYFFVKPLVIIDGELMSAFLDEKANIKIDRIDAAMIKFEFSTANYNRGCYAVDIISLQSLSKYLEFCEARHQKIFNQLLYCL